MKKWVVSSCTGTQRNKTLTNCVKTPCMDMKTIGIPQKCKSCLLFCAYLTNWEQFLPPSSPCDWILSQLYVRESCHTYSGFTKIMDNWQNMTAF